MLPEKSFDTGELVLNYAEGPDAGPPLVLLHGLTGWWNAWEPVLPQLTPAWHVYAVDLRGHGQSGRAGDHYVLTDYARDMRAFLRQVVTRPAVLLGHSLGALTSLATAALAADAVRALVLVDPPFTVRDTSLARLPEAHGWFKWVHDTVQDEPTFDQVLDRCQASAPELDPAGLQAMAAQISHVAAGTVAVALQDRLLEGIDLGELARALKCPTLLLWGDWASGATVRPADAAWFQAEAPKAQAVHIPQGSHSFLWEQPELTFAHLNTFFRSL